MKNSTIDTTINPPIRINGHKCMYLEDFAKFNNVSRQTVYNWINSGYRTMQSKGIHGIIQLKTLKLLIVD